MTTTPKARAQEALEDYTRWELEPLHGEIIEHDLTNFWGKHFRVVREALALSAVIEKIAAMPEVLENGFDVCTWVGNETGKWYSRASTESDEVRANDGYGGALAAIIAVLEALEKHAAAVKHSQEK